jgi:hypothetical protein
MAIRTRKKVGLSQESAIDLMQEIYTEIVDERNRALQTFKKFSRDTDENTDIAMVGKITNDLLKIVDSSIEKKIRLLKIQTDILYKTSKAGDDSDNDFKLDEKYAEQIHKEIKAAAEEMKTLPDTSEDNTTLNYH